MRFATINTSGWVQPNRREAGIGYLMQANLDVIAIQEAGISTRTANFSSLHPDFPNTYQAYCYGLAGLIIRKTIPVTNLRSSPDGRIVSIDVSLDTGNPGESCLTRVISVYAPVSPSERAAFFDNDEIGILQAYYDPNVSEVVVMGDLNDFPDALLDRDSTAVSAIARFWHKLAPFIEEAQLHDVLRTLHPDVNIFTNFVKQNGVILTRTRIDHILSTISPKGTISVTPFPYTDHSMVTWDWRPVSPSPIGLPTTIKRGDGSWMLHHGHIKDADLQEQIHQHLYYAIAAHGPTEWTWSDWLHLKQSTIQYLKQLTHARRSENSEQAVHRLRDLVSGMSLNDPSMEKTLQKLQHEEDILLNTVTAKLQSLRLDYEKHPSTKHEKPLRSAETPQFRMASGSLTKTSQELVDTVYTYYNTLNQQSVNANLSPPEEITSRLHRQNVAAGPLPSFYTDKISADEVKDRLRDSPQGSSPGIDGLPYEWYKIHQDLLCPVLASAINNVMTGAATTIPSYPTLLGKLLPKPVPDGKDPTLLQFKRPLNIADADYRLASLTMGKRLSYYADRLVTGNQTAFLKQRGMEENGLTTYLLMDHKRTALKFGRSPQHPADLTRTGTPAAGILFLDQEKAFDRVNWKYLWHVMEYYGIPQYIINFYQFFYTNPQTVYQVRIYQATHSRSLPQANLPPGIWPQRTTNPASSRDATR